MLEFKAVKKNRVFLTQEVILNIDDELLDDSLRSLIKAQQHLGIISFPLYAEVSEQEYEFRMKLEDHKRNKMKAWGTY